MSRFFWTVLLLLLLSANGLFYAAHRGLLGNAWDEGREPARIGKQIDAHRLTLIVAAQSEAMPQNASPASSNRAPQAIAAATNEKDHSAQEKTADTPSLPASQPASNGTPTTTPTQEPKSEAIQPVAQPVLKETPKPVDSKLGPAGTPTTEKTDKTSPLPASTGTLATTPASAPTPPVIPAATKSAPPPAPPVVTPATTPAPPATPTLLCLQANGLMPDDAQRLVDTLKTLGAKADSRAVEEPQSWMVYIPPSKTKEGLDGHLDELKKARVKDYFVIQDNGPMHQAISLGVFKQQDSAISYLNTLVSQGLKSAVVSPRTATRIALRINDIKESDQAKVRELFKAQVRNLQALKGASDLKPCAP